MTDLTEQWKKGELPEGAYYIRIGDKIVIDETVCTGDFYFHTDCDEVLAPVPSYEEWQALMDLYKEADVIIKKSDKENTKLKTDCKTLAQKLLQVKPELREWLEVNFKEYL